MSITHAIDVFESGHTGLGTVLLNPVRRGTVVLRIDQNLRPTRPSIYTIQVSLTDHLDCPNLRYLNHSCDPNVFVDTGARVVLALRDIAAGEELAFFYPSTEWDMVGPFACRCGARACLGEVRGASYLSAEVLARYRVNAHIRALRVD